MSNILQICEIVRAVVLKICQACQNLINVPLNNWGIWSVLSSEE